MPDNATTNKNTGQDTSKEQPDEAKENITGTGENPLRYPADLADHQGRTCVRFSIKDRNDLENARQSIWLYAPPGLSTADGVAYGQLDLGILAGVVSQIENEGIANALNRDNLESVGVAAGSAFAPDFLKGKSLFTTGNASNPFSVQQLAGTQPRSFNFTFKLVAHNDKESETCRLIENTFRKFMYPKMSASKLHLKYPPYFQIEFLTNGEANEHLPFINLSLLQNMTATYNQSSNVYHMNDGKGARPVEVDMSLTFIESRNMTRDDLYKDVSNIDSASYSYEYNGAGKAISTSSEAGTEGSSE